MTDTTTRSDLRMRLREYRKARGWTLAQVADAMGTTPQTVSRLETNVMTVSTDWLQRFADLFEVDVVDFFEPVNVDRPDFLGMVEAGGVVTPAPPPDLRLPALPNTVMVRMATEQGGFRPGHYLIAERLSDAAEAIDRICVAKLKDGPAVLARAIMGQGATFTLVPLDGGATHYDKTVEWMALPTFSFKDLRQRAE